MRSLSARRRGLDIWPGFVDALTSLIMVMVFVLIFVPELATYLPENMRKAPGG